MGTAPVVIEDPGQRVGQDPIPGVFLIENHDQAYPIWRDSGARDRIFAALVKLESDPRPGGAKKLKGGGELWRIQVGDYRIVYQVGDEFLFVLVVRIAHRRDVYR